MIIVHFVHLKKSRMEKSTLLHPRVVGSLTLFKPAAAVEAHCPITRNIKQIKHFELN